MAEMAEYFTPVAEVWRRTEAGMQNRIGDACLTAVANSMRFIRGGQIQKGVVPVSASWLKADGTLVSNRDITSGMIARKVFADMLPEIPFDSEEGAQNEGSSDSPFYIGYDDLDGSRADAVGAPTSTVICTVYNRDGSVHGAAIGDPSTGRMFSSVGVGNPVEGRTLVPVYMEDENVPVLIDTKYYNPDVRPWAGDLTDRGQIFIDNNQPYPRPTGGVFTADQHMALRSEIQKISAAGNEMGVASNGAHQLYVASGCERACVAFTSARGVPEDTSAGVFLREQQARMQGIDPETVVQRYTAIGGVIVATNVESPGYDLAAIANTPATLDRFHAMLISITK
ncbi:MAG TPA: hypothetical protein VLE73_04735 [Candidatus Saccharimonadales bacterium]|nr:hypothetical protein [Candidatus Saccharimonadales bacterium]